TRVILSQGGKDLQRADVVLTATKVQELRFLVSQERAGLYRYDIRVEPLPGEVTEVNNSVTCQVRVVDKPVRVLLLEGKPYWDTKFLQRTLLQDPSLDVDSLVRLGPNRFYLRRLIDRGPQAAASRQQTVPKTKILNCLLPRSRKSIAR